MAPREMSNDSTSQSSTSSRASLSVTPSVPASSAIGGMMMNEKPTSPAMSTSIVATAAKPGRRRRRNTSLTGVRSRVRNSAMTAGTTTGASSCMTHKTPSAAAAMTRRRQL